MRGRNKADIARGSFTATRVFLPIQFKTLRSDLCGIYEAETGMVSDGVYLEDNDKFLLKSAYLGDLNALAALKCLRLGEDDRYLVAALSLMEKKILPDQALTLILDTMVGVADSRPEGVSRADHFSRVLRILRKQKSVKRSNSLNESLDTEIENTLDLKREGKL